MAENWRPILGFEGYYEISDQGRVRSLPRPNNRNPDYHRARVLRPGRSRSRYFTVGLKVGGVETRRYIHRMVLEAFVGPARPDQEARHIDGTRVNNQLANLAWGTRKENAGDRVAHGTHPVGSRNGFAKLKETDIPGIRAAHAAGISPSAIARRFDVHRMTIVCITKGRTWTHV